jgi:hypothetical protein
MEKQMSDELKNLIADHERLATSHMALAKLCEQLSSQINVCLKEIYSLKTSKSIEIP